MSEDTKLEEGALSSLESVVMGIAGTAPAFSAAATTAALVFAVGPLAPASLLYCGLIMFGITLAYQQLNRREPNAGACYFWVSRAFHPLLGFFAGWSLLVASALFMVSGTVPAATATLLLIKPELVNDTGAVTFVAAGWLVAVGAVIVKGIKPTSYSQVVMTVIELGAMAAIIIAGMTQFASHGLHPLSLSWFSATAFTPELFATGALTSLFFFWGWDVSINLNEETKNAAEAPGKGVLTAMIWIILLFVTGVVATLLVLSDEEIQKSGTNVLFAMAEKLFPRPWSYLAIVAVMLSSIGTLETSILQFTRTMFAKARDGVLSPRYAQLHKTWRTPWLATAVVVSLGLAFLFLSSNFPSVDVLIKDSISALGFQIAFYYSLAGLACAWTFRREATQSLGKMISLCLWPLASALFLIFIAAYSIPTFDLTTNIVGIGGIALGAVPLWLNRKNSVRA